MKWTIQELIKKSKSSTSLNFRLKLNDYITEEIEDLVDISETLVVGNFEYIADEELFIFYLNFKTKLTMLCALTLEEVEVELDFNSELNFSTDPLDDDTHKIEGITIELDQYIFSEILIEKPMKVYAPGALENYHEDIYEINEEEKVSSNPFAKLKQ